MPGVLDAYGLPAAHVVGVSAGGAMAQLLALDDPDRVLSLVLISTSPALPVDRDLPPVLLERPHRCGRDRTEDAVHHHLAVPVLPQKMLEASDWLDGQGAGSLVAFSQERPVQRHVATAFLELAFAACLPC